MLLLICHEVATHVVKEANLTRATQQDYHSRGQTQPKSREEGSIGGEVITKIVSGEAETNNAGPACLPLLLPGDLGGSRGVEVEVTRGLFSQYQRWLAHLCTPTDDD